MITITMLISLVMWNCGCGTQDGLTYSAVRFENTYVNKVYVFYDEKVPAYYLADMLSGIKRDLPGVECDVVMIIKYGESLSQRIKELGIDKNTLKDVSFDFRLSFPPKLKHLPAVSFITLSGIFTYYGVADWETIKRQFRKDVKGVRR